MYGNIEGQVVGLSYYDFKTEEGKRMEGVKVTLLNPMGTTAKNMGLDLTFNDLQNAKDKKYHLPETLNQFKGKMVRVHIIVGVTSKGTPTIRVTNMELITK